MRPLLVLLAAGLAGCVSTAPPPLAPAPPPVVPPVVRVEPPAPVPIQIEPEPVESAPATPPDAPRLRIAERSVYEADRVAVWTLENGLTVVYAWDPDALDYTVLVTSASRAARPVAGLAVAPSGVQLADVSPRLDDAMGGARAAVVSGGAAPDPARARVMIHGPLDWEWVEAAVATELGQIPSSLAGSRSSADRSGPSVEVGWADLPALLLAARVLAARAGGQVAVSYDAARGSATVRGAAVGSAFAPTSAGELQAAQADLRPADLLVALDALFSLPGSFRPSRPVSDARALSDRLQRTPAARVDALLARLARALSSRTD